jgi:phosphoribosylformylglycinamidine synthase subunit PurL
LDFKNEGDVIYMLGESRADINGSEYLFKLHDVKFSPAPHFELKEEAELQNKVAELIKNKHILSAHDVTEGGLFVTLMESAAQHGKGFDINYTKDIRKDAFLFGESQSRVVVSVAAGNVAAFESAVGNHPLEKLGTVTSGNIIIAGEDWGNIALWKEKYDTAIEKELA